MTNREKFKEVFGFDLDRNVSTMCPAPKKICRLNRNCPECPFQHWWDKEYKPCFKLREDFE